MKISSALRLCLPFFFAAGLAISNANAQAPDSWPSKQVRIVVPYVAGAMGDVVARRLTEGLRNELGQAVLVENRPGAGGNIGTQLVEQSADQKTGCHHGVGGCAIGDFCASHHSCE